METIGVIGLGIIGTPWATRYQAAGKLAGVWNRTPKPEAPAWKATAREVTEAADITHIVVADPPAVSAVLDAILPAIERQAAPEVLKLLQVLSERRRLLSRGDQQVLDGGNQAVEPPDRLLFQSVQCGIDNRLPLGCQAR